jgi:hypothetical protein
MSQTDDCVIQVHGHKMSTTVFILKFSTCCCNTNLGDYYLTMSCYLSFLCFKVTLRRITVWQAGTSNRAVVPARQAGNRFLGSLKNLQIRALL